MQDRSPCPTETLDSAPRTRELVARLQHAEIFRDYRDAFETTTGLPLTMRAAGSFRTPQEGSRQLNPFCALMAAQNKTCAGCLQLQQRLEQDAATGPRTRQCFSGLSDSLVPIHIGGEVVAYLQTGQVLLGPPSRARFQKTLHQLHAWGVEANPKTLAEAYGRTRVLRKAQYDSAIRLLAIFAQQLESVANQLMVTESLAESPTVARARAFIAANLGEDLCLARVAGAVNVSEFYFCKIFKEATGLTFTDYVARLRIESVKQLLLNPHTRVSEAAYAVGFQSLSQFNRTFRRVVGTPPSAYREKLHGPAAAPARPLAHAA